MLSPHGKDEHVGPRTTHQDVTARAARDRVVATIADDHLVAGRAIDQVVAIAAVNADACVGGVEQVDGVRSTPAENLRGDCPRQGQRVAAVAQNDAPVHITGQVDKIAAVTHVDAPDDVKCALQTVPCAITQYNKRPRAPIGRGQLRGTVGAERLGPVQS